MEPRSGTFCMECSHLLVGPPVLRSTPEGGSCRACADRLLDAVPGIFHTAWPTSRNQAPATAEDPQSAREPAGALLRGPWHGASPSA